MVARVRCIATQRRTELTIANFAVADIVSAPLLPQAKVNKALIALVQKKLVTKTVSGVSDALSQRSGPIQLI